MSRDDGGAVDAGIRRLLKRCPECTQHYSADSMFCPFDGTPLEDAVWVAPTDPTLNPLLNTVVDGRYRIMRVLGEGGTGTVYEVLHEALARPFAMKVLRAAVARDADLAGRFMQEVRATGSLKHPHIVSITDFGRLADQTPYFVMERLSGQTLAQLCKARGKLPLARAIRIVLQVADAVGAAHAAGIVHRDLKPENLFLVGKGADGEGGQDDVRVVDFGAAKIVGGTRITKTGVVFGTPHYMSPEQAAGQPVDHRADIYALGVIMYELFTGHLPFNADTLMGVLGKHLFQPPPPFPTLDPGDTRAPLMAALEGVTRRALAKKPVERIQAMDKLAAELARIAVFDEDGGVALARDAAGDGPREGKRADGYAGEDLPVVATSSLRGTLLVVAGGLALVGLVAGLALRPSGGGAAASPSASAPAARDLAAVPASSLASAAPASVHLTTVPPFAEVWQGGKRIGTAPMDLPIDPTGAPTQCTLRAPGYVERALVVDRASTATMLVTLDQATPAQPRRPSSPAPRPRPRPSDSELVDPFAR